MSTCVPKNLGRTKGASPQSTSKAKKHSLEKHPLDRLDTSLGNYTENGSSKFGGVGLGGLGPNLAVFSLLQRERYQNEESGSLGKRGPF